MNALLLVLSLLHPTALDAGDDQYQLVAGLYEKGLHKMVVAEANTFLEEHPRHPKATLARYRLGLSLFELGRLDDAAPQFQALVRQPSFQFRSESALRLAQCQLAADDLRGAGRSLEAALESDADYLRLPATFLLGEVRFRREDFANAADSYRQALELASTGNDDASYAIRSELGLTWCAYRTGDHTATAEHARRFLRRHADDDLAGEVRFLHGEALLELDRPREALEAFTRVGDDAHADGALRGAGFALAALGEPARSAEAFGDLLERFPQSPYAAEAAFQRGIQLLEAGDPSAARQAFGAPQVPADAETSYWRAWAEAKDGDAEASRHSLQRALRQNPSDALRGRIQALLGDVLHQLGREGDAVEAYRDSGSDYALQAAAVASINAGRAEEATRLARALLKDHPESSYRGEALLTLGEGLFQLEQWSDAEDAFGQAAAALQDGDSRLRCAARRGWCRYLAGDLAGAAERFESLATDHPRAPQAEEAAFMAARARLESGDRRAAKRWFERYLESYRSGEKRDQALLEMARLQEAEGAATYRRLLAEHSGSPAVPEALYELAELLAQNGRTDEARSHYDTLLAQHAEHELAAAALYGVAWCQFEAGDFAEAAQSLRAFQRSGRVPDALVVSGLELLVFSECKAGNPQAAVAPYQRFAERCADEERNFAVARTLAQALRAAGETERAQAVLEDTLARTENQTVMASALVEGVYLSLERDDVSDAEARALVAKRRAPDDPAVGEALFFVAEAHFEAGRDEKAADLYLQSAGTPQCPVADAALYKAGFALLRHTQDARAAQAFETLVEQHPRSDLRGESLFLAGEARFRMGEYAEAVEHLGRLREESPRHEVMPKALFRGGVALCHLERWDDAQRWLSRLAQRHTDFDNLVEADLWRGRALAGSGDPRGARQAFERVTARDRGVLAARARLELGHLRLANEELEGALSEYLKVAVLYASGDEVAEALWMAGQCLEQLGDPERARAQYDELLTDYPGSRFNALARERLQRLQ